MATQSELRDEIIELINESRSVLKSEDEAEIVVVDKKIARFLAKDLSLEELQTHQKILEELSVLIFDMSSLLEKKLKELAFEGATVSNNKKFIGKYLKVKNV